MKTVALVGNPNVGKSSLFNAITGARQYVANWPGVTVSRKEGTKTWRGVELKFVDLPGIYSLGAISLDEKVTRDYLLREHPDVIVVVVDALNMEQGLFLLIEVLEMRENVMLVVNSIDEARKKNLRIDKYELEKHFGVHVVFTSAVTGEGIEELLDRILHIIRKREVHSFVNFKYQPEIEERINDIEKKIENVKELSSYKKRWLAIKALERDPEVVEILGDYNIKAPSELEAKKFKEMIAQRRYEYIDSVLREAMSIPTKKMSLSEALDHVITHKFLGIPIFLAMMYLAFSFTFDVMSPFSDLIDRGFSALGEWMRTIMGSGWVTSLVVNGVIGGVGAVLVFVPNIFGMFLALGFMEEVGYLPRAAFVIDKLMYKLKLSGRSFMSLILGFGCNVPAVMSTRGIPDYRERLITILVSPFITCSARLPTYILLAGIFFKGKETVVIFSIYLSSIVLTAISATVLNKVLFKGQPVPLVMELPRYRLPSAKNLWLYVWERGKHFLEKAGTIILISAIIIWFLGNFPSAGDNSLAADLGKIFEPIFRPLGYDWKMVTALIFGAAAKEVVVSTFQMMYGNPAEVLPSVITPYVALSFMFFVMAYMPCFATVAVIKSEAGGWKWATFSILYSLAVAYTIALLISLVGRLIW